MAGSANEELSDALGPPSLADTLGGSASFRRRRGNDVGFRLHIDDLLRYVVNIGASDLHLTSNLAPTVRLHGALRAMDDVEPLDAETLQEMIFGVLPQTMRERFEAEHELDTSHSVAGVGRFRVNVALQRGSVAVALRPIPHDIPEFANLGLPEPVRSFTDLRRGLVLVTGPTGSGKSTSLGLVDRHHQPVQAAPHRHGGGPDRVPSHPQAIGDQPAGGRLRHGVVLRGPSTRAAPRPRRDPGRRASGP